MAARYCISRVGIMRAVSEAEQRDARQYVIAPSVRYVLNRVWRVVCIPAPFVYIHDLMYVISLFCLLLWRRYITTMHGADTTALARLEALLEGVANRPPLAKGDIVEIADGRKFAKAEVVGGSTCGSYYDVKVPLHQFHLISL